MLNSSADYIQIFDCCTDSNKAQILLKNVAYYSAVAAVSSFQFHAFGKLLLSTSFRISSSIFNFLSRVVLEMKRSKKMDYMIKI